MFCLLIARWVLAIPEDCTSDQWGQIEIRQTGDVTEVVLWCHQFTHSFRCFLSLSHTIFCSLLFHSMDHSLTRYTFIQNVIAQLVCCLYMSMCVCVCVCICVCMSMHVWTCMCVCVCVCVCVCAHVHACRKVYVYVCVCVCVHAHVCECTWIYTHLTYKQCINTQTSLSKKSHLS